MRRSLSLVFSIFAVVTFSACQTIQPAVQSDIPFDQSPGAVIVRIYSESPGAPLHFQHNQLVTCTVYGDGRVVWAGPLEGGGDQLLEGTASPEDLQNYYRRITELGFFGWSDEVSTDVLPPEGTNAYTVIEVELADRLHRVAAYNGGALHGFEDIVRWCQELVDDPALIEPRAGWLTAYPADPVGSRSFVCWPVEAPVRLADLAAQGQSYWLEGPYAVFTWSMVRETSGVPIFAEGGSCSGQDEVQAEEPLTFYYVTFQVPGFNVYAPPPPAQPE